MPTVPEAEAPPAAVEPDSSPAAAAPAADEPVPGSSSLALGQSAVDVDLEHAFFTRGLSDEAMQAVTEKEGEREFLHQARPPGRRRLISIAACGVLVLVAVGLGVRGFFTFTGRDLRTKVDPAPVAANQRAAAPQPRPSIDKMPLELVPPVAAVPRIVSVSELRARVPEGPLPAPQGQAAAPPSESAPPTSAEAAAEAAAAPAAAKTEAAKTEPVQAAEAPVAGGKAATPTSTSTAAAPAPSPAQQRLASACAEGLHAGKYREVEGKCKAAFAAAPAAGLATDVAQAAFEHGRNADAAAWAKKAIGVDPKLAQAFVLLGGAEQQLGHAAEARAAYNRYLELAPNGAHAQDVRALLPGLAQQ
jgi:hypothetical protein